MTYKPLNPGEPGADFWVAGSGAFKLCTLCKGRGCLSCKEQYEAYMCERAKPIFTANTDDPEEMRELNAVIGARALEAAFGPGGGGAQEIELNAAVQSLSRYLRTHKREESNGQDDVEGQD